MYTTSGHKIKENLNFLHDENGLWSWGFSNPISRHLWPSLIFLRRWGQLVWPGQTNISKHHWRWAWKICAAKSRSTHNHFTSKFPRRRCHSKPPTSVLMAETLSWVLLAYHSRLRLYGVLSGFFMTFDDI